MYEIVGTKGRVRVEPAYEYVGSLSMSVTIGGKTRTRSFRPGDQFAPQLIYFADCVREGAEPEPNGVEGLIDVQIVEALHRAAQHRRAVSVRFPVKRSRPDHRLQMYRPPVTPPKQIHTRAPTL
jgi:glucose-fructose oxidoreductase